MTHATTRNEASDVQLALTAWRAADKQLEQAVVRFLRSVENNITTPGSRDALRALRSHLEIERYLLPASIIEHLRTPRP